LIWGAAFSGRETGELMFTRVLCAAAFAAGFFCAGAGFSGYAEAAPLEAYGTLPTLDDPEISPDGNSIAYLRSSKGKRFVLVQSLQTKQVIGAVDVREEKLRDISWADSKNVIITTSQTTNARGLVAILHEWYLSVCFNLDTKKTIPLMEYFPDNMHALNVVGSIPQARVIDGRAVVFVVGIYYPSSTVRYGVFMVDLETASVRLIEGGSKYTSGFLVDAQGTIVATSEYDTDTHRWSLKQKFGGSSKITMDVAAPIDIPSIEGFSYDGNAIIVSLINNGQAEYRQFAVSDGSAMAPLRSDLRLEYLFSEAQSNRVIGGIQSGERQEYVFFHPRAQTVWNSVKAAYPGASDVTIASWSQDWNKVVVHVAGPRQGDVYDLVDMHAHTADRIGDTYAGITSADYSSIQWITYSAGDGRSISAYLTLPRNRPAQSLPLIVLPHGGPESRDNASFDWISQAFASRGYAVLQPQFRGSSGFGIDLVTAGYGQWGRKMQTDLSDGVRALASKGVIDAKRVCIVGASYGGYAALAGVTLETGVYRCAVSLAGIGDLRTMLTWDGRWRYSSDGPTMKYWDRFLGVTGASDPVLATISPISHVSKVTVPILLIHGKDDTTVLPSQSEDMAAALRRAGKSFELVKLDDEDHWLSTSQTRQQMLSTTVRFLEQHNPPN